MKGEHIPTVQIHGFTPILASDGDKSEVPIGQPVRYLDSVCRKTALTPGPGIKEPKDFGDAGFYAMLEIVGGPRDGVILYAIDDGFIY